MDLEIEFLDKSYDAKLGSELHWPSFTLFQNFSGMGEENDYLDESFDVKFGSEMRWPPFNSGLEGGQCRSV